jgi:hypothetical protein
MEYKDKVEVDQEFQNIIYPLVENWKQYSEEEVERLIKEIGKICRKEFSIYRKRLLIELKNFTEILLIIAKFYENNTVILVEILSSWYCLYNQYGINLSDEVFKFLISLKKGNNVRLYTAILIIQLPLFETYENKWIYILSISKIVPRRKSISVFYTAVWNNKDMIPIQYRENIIAVFQEAIEKFHLHPTTVDKYNKLIDLIR